VKIEGLGSDANATSKNTDFRTERDTKCNLRGKNKTSSDEETRREKRERGIKSCFTIMNDVTLVGGGSKEGEEHDASSFTPAHTNKI
jgi:hypothetical protein